MRDSHRRRDMNGKERKRLDEIDRERAKRENR